MDLIINKCNLVTTELLINAIFYKSVKALSKF